MKNALIGYSGFVGSTLLKQTTFNDLYRSTNIQEIRGQCYESVVCAGAPAQKWLANKDPVADTKKIDALIEHLSTIKCKQFILISTVDVFKSPVDVDETTSVDTNDLHTYGLNRYRLEQFVQEHFDDSLIVRLPGLVGPGLKKNIIFDLLNNNNLEQIESRNVFQFYPMVNLWFDIQTALSHKLKLIHLTAEPISVGSIAKQGFGINFENPKSTPIVSYNFKSCYANLFGADDYQYNQKETLLAVRSYAQSEPKKA